MGINGVSSASQGLGYNKDDLKLKEYDHNLNRLQQKLQRTDKDIDLSEPEKKKKQQELQREIEEVRRKKLLAEHEERQKEMPGSGKIAEKKTSGIDQSADPEKNKKEDSVQVSAKQMEAQKAKEKDAEKREEVLSSNDMGSVISQNDTLAQTKPHMTTIKELENRIRVLNGEIKLDQVRNTDTTKKEAEMKNLEQRATTARENTIKNLGSKDPKAEKLQEDAQKEMKKQQQTENIRFIRSQKDSALPNFQISI